ncbi:Phosphoesterase [Nitrospira sp. KM1]|uniref:PHP domain-containing protein n=1 Tax=Nitrospira sp. KM1 TaxID=1936990 RepID=UPI0013A72801|nr:PHP domain-containing protein [Nitrospira sp. KM1]BCA57016.1 Phosphoesterase [Nitrospira sp. KM1]
MSRIDLHLHTTHSDGSLPPVQVVLLAQKARVTALAITDHDITSGIPEAMTAGAALGVEVIPGVEISSFDGQNELHILGYCMDWKDEQFNRRLATLRQSRHRRNPLIIERLRAEGLDVTYGEVKTLAGTEAVGRPHIAQLLMQKKYVNSAKEAFDRYLAEGKPAYVARELPPPSEAIDWIKNAGGVAVLAHPTWAKKSEGDLRVCVTGLKDAGLGGIEVHYSTHTKSQTSTYLNLARELGLLITGGSDFHGLTKPDIAVGTGRGGLTVNPDLLDPLKNAAARV